MLMQLLLSVRKRFIEDLCCLCFPLERQLQRTPRDCDRLASMKDVNIHANG